MAKFKIDTPLFFVIAITIDFLNPQYSRIYYMSMHKIVIKLYKYLLVLNRY